jgi:hypothetical protein
VDPADPHSLVTLRRSLFEIDFSDRSVLSISTLEHVGTGQYGLGAETGQVLHAVAKVIGQARNCLLTVPVGYNDLLDKWLFANADAPREFTIRFLVRMPDELTWRQEAEPSRARRPRKGKGRKGVESRGGAVA